ncbi:MAG: hypothetical protein RR177_05960 [Oscillospiraceae bacterium]
MEKNMDRMQREAAERVREMSRRSKFPPESGNMPIMPDFVKTEFNSPEPYLPKTASAHSQQKEKCMEEVKKPPRRGFDLLKMFNFKNFKLDNDILLIIMLFLILSADECDEILLLALVYIMI